MSVLIQNGRVITAVDDYEADIFIEDEKISVIGKDLQMNADKVIDAKGKYVIPGGIDPHTHFDFPFGGTMSADDFETDDPCAQDFGDGNENSIWDDGNNVCIKSFGFQDVGIWSITADVSPVSSV